MCAKIARVRRALPASLGICCVTRAFSLRQRGDPVCTLCHGTVKVSITDRNQHGHHVFLFSCDLARLGPECLNMYDPVWRARLRRGGKADHLMWPSNSLSLSQPIEAKCSPDSVLVLPRWSTCPPQQSSSICLCQLSKSISLKPIESNRQLN